MLPFAIVAVDNGLTIVEVQLGESPDEAAVQEHGVVANPGPFATYEDANDALCGLEGEEEERRA